MNLAIPLGADLADAAESVQWELIRYLQAHGARVAVIYAPDASALWRETEEALSPPGSDRPPPEAIASAFARAVEAESPYDRLVMPSLVYRDARVEGRVAQWDGVRRRIRFVPGLPEAATPDVVQAMENRIEASPSSREVRGKITGLSFHTLVFDGQGKLVFQGLGGLDLVHVVREGKGAEGSSLRLQPQLLADAANVREGIAVALDPYLVANAATR